MEIDLVPVQFSVRLPKDLARRLRAIAEERRTTPADLIEQIVADYVRQDVSAAEGTKPEPSRR